MFLHSVKEGPANQSYGLQVAALAGIPKSVTAQARRYLTELERERDALRTLRLAARRTAAVRRPPTTASSSRGAAESAALEALRAVDPNALSPRDALDLLFRLKQLDRGDTESAARRNRNFPVLRNAAVCAGDRLGKRHPRVADPQHHMVLGAPPSRVSSTRMVPSFGPSSLPSQPAEADAPSCPRSRPGRARHPSGVARHEQLLARTPSHDLLAER